MIFNKDNKGSEELQAVTGNYYASNNFEKIEMDIQLQEEGLIELIGQEVYDRAEDHYLSEDYQVADPSPEQALDDALVQHIQLPVAMLATHKFYQGNIVSHEDAGRKIKIDANNEKLPWEWMLDRDDQSNLLKGYSSIDRLIRFLEKNNLEEWRTSNARKASLLLFVNNTAVFQKAYPIGNSPRFFYTVLPFIAEVQRKLIKPALGAEKYRELLDYFQHVPDTNPESGSSPDETGSSADESGSSPEEGELADLLAMVQTAIPMYTMIIAVKRLSLQVLPEGVVQQFSSLMQSRGASQIPIQQVITDFICELKKSADIELNDIKKYVQSTTSDFLDYPLLPANDKCNKFFRT